MTKNCRMTFLVAAFTLSAGLAHAANPETMKTKCQERAAGALGVPAGSINVRYEGQRTDKTHAVNGSALVHGQDRTFQCSFAADGQRIAKFVVNPAKGGAAQQTHASSGNKEADATRRAGAGQFDARGPIPCAKYKGQPMGQCQFGVARAGGGSATVVVTHPDGSKRTIFFSKGKATGADTSQADGSPAFRSSKVSDLYMISIGDERYEIPEAVVFGG